VNKNGESKLATSPDPASKSRDGSASRRVSEIPESSTVAIADLAARMRREGHKVVDFSAGRAAEHSPDLACEAAIEAMRSGQTHQTEARGRPEYLQACSEKLQRCNGLTLDPGSNIIATLGCKQGLVLSLLASIDAGDEVIIEDPCFVSYAPTIRLLGGVPVIVPLMPAGVVHTRDDLDVISNIAVQHDLTVIADEIYEAVTWNGRSHIPMFGLPGMESRTIGLMGMTKSYSMGGWRIGYAYAAPNYIAAMTKLQQHLMTCAGSFTQLGAARALAEDVTDAMRPLWTDWEARCRYVTEELNGHPLFSVTMPEGGFYAWVDISKSGLSSQDFSARLVKERQVATVPGGSFGPASDNHVRPRAHIPADFPAGSANLIGLLQYS
jgi:aspartate/methionine/tyrosine aminotransferase